MSQQFTFPLKKYVDLFGGVYKQCLTDIDGNMLSDETIQDVINSLEYFIPATQELDKFLYLFLNDKKLGKDRNSLLDTLYIKWINSPVLDTILNHDETDDFSAFCRYGHLEMAKMYYQKNKAIIDTTLETSAVYFIPTYLTLACKYNQVEMLDWLISITKSPNNIEKKLKHLNMISVAAQNGAVEIAEYLTQNYTYKKHNIEFIMFPAFCNHTPHFLHWLLTKYENYNMDIAQVLYLDQRHGFAMHLETVRYLYERYPTVIHQDLVYVASARKDCCETVKWFVKTFPSIKCRNSNDRSLLQDAITIKNLDLIKYLDKHIELTPDRDTVFALSIAGDVDIIVWVLDRFPHLKEQNGKLFRDLVDRLHYDTALYVAGKYEIKMEWPHMSLRSCLDNDRYDIAKYIITRYYSESKDVAEINDLFCTVCAYTDDCSILTWMRDNFPIDLKQIGRKALIKAFNESNAESARYILRDYTVDDFKNDTILMGYSTHVVYWLSEISG